MPPEEASETPHLMSAPRGASIFWRMMRPELVRTNAVKAERLTALVEEINKRWTLNDPLTEDLLKSDDDHKLSDANDTLFRMLPPEMRTKLVEERYMHTTHAPYSIPI